jgi:superfamily II DNA helicase RecQ
MACISSWVKKYNLKEMFKTKKVLDHVSIPSMFTIKPSQMDLKKKLLEWRFKKAKDMGIPPYCILSNKSIDDILDKKPADINGLMDIYGMGTKRCDKYGKDILDII